VNDQALVKITLGRGCRPEHDGAVCHLRALYRSEKGQWDAFWGRDYAHN